MNITKYKKCRKCEEKRRREALKREEQKRKEQEAKTKVDNHVDNGETQDA